MHCKPGRHLHFVSRVLFDLFRSCCKMFLLSALPTKKKLLENFEKISNFYFKFLFLFISRLISVRFFKFRIWTKIVISEFLAIFFKISSEISSNFRQNPQKRIFKALRYIFRKSYTTKSGLDISILKNSNEFL